MNEGRKLVEAVREAARKHGDSWDALVPSTSCLNLDAEAAEEQAYADMALSKRALRDHICAIYGISVDELHSIATC